MPTILTTTPTTNTATVHTTQVQPTTTTTDGEGLITIIIAMEVQAERAVWLAWRDCAVGAVCLSPVAAGESDYCRLWVTRTKWEFNRFARLYPHIIPD